MALGETQASSKFDEKMGNGVKELLKCRQKIELKGEETESFELCCNDIIIECPNATHVTGSSDVKLISKINFHYDVADFPGKILAVHKEGKYYAYGLKNNLSKSPGDLYMIRVVNRETDQRVLIRGLKSMVRDITFAYLSDDVILASVDDEGTVLVHWVMEPEGTTILSCKLLLEVLRDSPVTQTDSHKLAWCPYIPEDGSTPGMLDCPNAQLLVYSHGCETELWSVSSITDVNGLGPVNPLNMPKGYLTIPPTESVITDVAFAPDGTALALATKEGSVLFYQIYMTTGAAPRVLHKWKPHGDQSVSFLSFINKKNSQETLFWKWAITGASENSEFKLWTCDNWECVQTIRLHSISPSHKHLFKAELDPSTNYLIVSDVIAKMLYIFNLHLTTKGPIYVSIVSGFRLREPMFCFGAFDARLISRKAFHERTVDEDDIEPELENIGVLNDAEPVNALFVNMIVLHHKSIYECKIGFKLDPKPSTISTDSLTFTDDVSATTTKTNGEVIGIPISPVLDESKSSMSDSLNNTSLNLMTPDAFSSPVRPEDESITSNNSLLRVSHTPPAPSLVPDPSELQDTTVEESPGDISKEIGLASGGSSPSREVQQILSMKDTSDEMNEDDSFYETKDDEFDTEKLQVDVSINSTNESKYTWPQIPIVPSQPSAKDTEKIENVLPTNTIINEIEALKSLIIQQQHEMKLMREEIARIAVPPRTEIKKEQDLSLEFEIIIAKHFTLMSKNLEAQLNDYVMKMTNTLCSTLAKSVDTIIGPRTQSLLQHEIQLKLVPVVQNACMPIKDVVRAEITERLKGTDHLLRESVNQLVFSKGVQDSLTNSLANIMQPAINNTFREVVSRHVIPSFERTCKALFSQLDESFGKGIREHLMTLDTYAEKQRKIQQDSSTEILNKFNANVTEQIKTMNDIVKVGNESNIVTVRKELIAAVSQLMTSIQESILRSSQEVIIDTINKNMRANNVVSRSSTPLPRNPQPVLTELLALVNQGQLNNAFQTALSASNLPLVVNLCERVPADKVFSQTPCPLQQPVLLSLIQQLSMELQTKTELKVRYLEEAVMNLDKEHPVTKEHMTHILTILRKNLNDFLQGNPNSPVTRTLRILLMASEGLLK